MHSHITRKHNPDYDAECPETNTPASYWGRKKRVVQESQRKFRRHGPIPRRSWQLRSKCICEFRTLPQ